MVARVSLILIISSILISYGLSAEIPGLNHDEIAIRQAVESYVAAYNAANASALASHWSKNGTYLTNTGELAKGPEKIKSVLEKFFAENKGIQVKASVFDIQSESRDRAIVKGFAVFSRPGEKKEEVLFTLSGVKEMGGWKILKFDEEESSVPLATIAQLGQLEWLMGDWVDKDEKSRVETSFRWAKDFAFIHSNFRVTLADRIDLEGSQIIGWDPLAKEFRSWIFDTKAGFGEGEWSRAGDTWTVRVKSTLGNGAEASSINVYKYVDPNSFTWRSYGRELNGEPLPDIDEVTVTRKKVPNKQQ